MRVVLVGGLGNDAAYFAGLRTHLLALDVPTAFVPFGSRAESRLRDIVRSHPPEQVALVGNSVGALVALRVALDTGPRRVVLINPPTLFPELHDASARHNASLRTHPSYAPLRPRWWKDLRPLLWALRVGAPLRPLRHALRLLYERANPQSPPCVVDNIFRTDLAAQAQLLVRYVLQNDLWSALRALAPRVHILQGSHDDFAHLARVVRDAVPHVTVKTYHGGHHHALHHPETVAAMIASSLAAATSNRKVSSRSSSS